jgi:UDP-glucose 4-epimerase
VDATIASIETTLENGTFNIASGNETTVLELAKTVQRIAGSQIGLEFCPPRTGDIPRSVADTARAKKELGFDARTSLEDGLSATIGWFMRQKQARPA